MKERRPVVRAQLEQQPLEKQPSLDLTAFAKQDTEVQLTGMTVMSVQLGHTRQLQERLRARRVGFLCTLKPLVKPRARPVRRTRTRLRRG
jgi:hypothetical protein